jgi:hypothetical protein
MPESSIQKVKAMNKTDLQPNTCIVMKRLTRIGASGVPALVLAVCMMLSLSTQAQLTVVKNKDVTCHGRNDGSATANVIGGTPPYTYLWSNGETSNTANNLGGGTHSVTVTDAHQCEVSGSVAILEPPPLNVSIAGGPATIKYCNNETPPKLTLTASASGGVPPYTFTWTGGVKVVSETGTYSVKVTDQKGCFKTASVKVEFIEVRCSQDPNDITGPSGRGEEHWINRSDPMPFRIRFENDPKFATAPAQKVTVNLPLDSNFNMYSFRLSDFGFGSFVFQVPANSTFYTTRLDVRDSLGIFVDVLAGLNVNTREAFWIFESIDPLTGLAPQDALSGFLPVNDTITHKGEGFVNFKIAPAGNVSSGDSILAKASIVFDVNSPIETNTWKNTIDALPPVTYVNPVSSVQDSAFFVVSFTANDDPGGSGVDFVELFVRRNDDPYLSYGKFPADSSVTFSGTAGNYKFYSLGTDLAGNKEVAKTNAEAQVIILDSLLFEISGNLTYANTAQTPLSAVTVYINRSIELRFDSAYTDSAGHFSFSDLSRGQYYLSTKTSLHWGGVTATDALIVSKHTVGLENLIGIKQLAADVNASGSISSTDALEIRKRVIGVTNSFTAGDWVFETDSLTIVNDTIDNAHYQGLSTGDVNASLSNPNARIHSTLNLIREGMLRAPTGVPFELPVFIESSADVAAITLFLEYNPDLVEVLDVRSPYGSMLFNASKRQVRCAWDSIKAIPANPDKPFMSLIVRTRADIDLNQVLPFNLLTGSELADYDANILDGVTLRIPNLNFAPGDFELYPCYPNPFRESTVMRYDLPSAGQASLQLLNMLGQVVYTLSEGYQEAGRFEIRFDASQLPVGIYQCRLIAETADGNFTKTIKVIHYKD